MSLLNLADTVKLSLFRPCFLAVILSFAVIHSARAGGDAAHGQALFSSRCLICHTITTQSKIGPGLAGVYGRIAGTAPSFRYSKAMIGYAKRWDEVTLGRFLASPSKAVPGTTMTIVVPEASDRADIVAYLRGLKDRH